MARAVGLDIGTRSIKVVELSGGPKAFRIQRLAIREVPRPPAEGAEPPAEGAEPFDPIAATAEVVREVFDSLKLPKEDVCASFDSGTTVSREIVVPFLEAEKIRKVVKFEAEHHLHSQSVDEVVVNWIKTGETKEGSRLTIFASSKEELVQKLAVMRMAGIEPASIDLDCTAVFTCCDAMGLFVEHPNAILLDVGAHVTALTLVIDGKPRMVRSFLLGVGNLPPALPAGSRAGGGSDLFVTATSMQAAPAAAATAELAPKNAHLDFVRKLHREVIRSLASVRSDAPPTVVFLGGGGALLPEVPEALQEKFGLPVQRLNVFEKAECRDQGPDPAYAGAVLPNAVGCALRLLGHNPLNIELLQDEFAPSNTFDVIRTAAATVVTLLFLVLLGLNYLETRERQASVTLNDGLYQQLHTVFQMAEAKYLEKVEHVDKATAEKKALDWVKDQRPAYAKRIGNMRSKLIARHTHLKDMLGQAKNIPEIKSALRVYYELVKAFSEVPRDQWGDWFQIEQFNCNERRLSFTIVTTQVRDIDEVARLASKSEYFKDRARESRVIEKTGTNSKLPNGRESQAFEIKFKEDR